MKKTVAVCMLGLFIAGCGNSPPPQKVALTCADNPEGRTREERQQIADSCFLTKGSFKKSKPVEW